jgi:nucleotide-binding universal stress UspA family protein
MTKPGNEAQRSATILVPLDGSTRALAALPVARSLAKLVDGTVRMLHVADVLPGPELRERLKLEIEDLHGAVLDARAGDPATAIVQAAEEWRSFAVVMCAYTGALKPAPGLGSVAEAALHAALPLVFVQPDRPNVDFKLNRVLIPHDGAPATAAALGFGAHLAHRAGAELVILHVAAFGAEPQGPGSTPVPQYMDQPQYEWETWTSEFVERLRCLCGLPREASMHLHLATGDPGSEIVRFAAEHEASLIILAWHGCLDAQRATALKTVLARASCPVLVLPVHAPVSSFSSIAAGCDMNRCSRHDMC